ncbi:MAG: peptidoglycan DD-metalloendopeptidase family protein [Clostridia bacterium]|nr:peptidoglycan DD-metalloendopeptidase family protein [Clostridia bacterium]
MKKVISVLMALLMLTSVVSVFGMTAAAANYTSSYWNYTEPSGSDYAYWNGKKMVKHSGTWTTNIKWMQASLNWCIRNKGLNASLLDVDGSFGPASKKATLAFQKKFGLSADGSFGPSTIQRMKDVQKGRYPKQQSSSYGKYNLLWPLPANSGYKVSSRLGNRTAPLKGGSTNHKGIDIAVKSGTKIYSVADGKVIDVGYSSARGYYIVVLHEGQDLISIYQHMKASANYKMGAYVSKGSVIGYVGTTGNSTGNHLHYGLVVASSTSRRSVNADQVGTLINPIQSNSNINYSYKN